LEQEYVGPCGREVLQVADRGLPFGAGEGRLDGGHIVEMQDRDQMIVGGATARGAYRSLADFIFAQAGNLLGDRDVLVEIMFVERARVTRRLVHHQKSRHPRAPSSLPGGKRRTIRTVVALSLRRVAELGKYVALARITRLAQRMFAHRKPALRLVAEHRDELRAL